MIRVSGEERMKLAAFPSPKYKTDLRTESRQVPQYKDYSK